MLIGGRTLTHGTRIEAEVAVVGAGPAGIVTALELARAGHDVVLLESGGEAFDPATQALGDTAGDDPFHAPMAFATRREVGGASILWGGRCVPFDPIDFAPREMIDGEWPVAYEELTPYFQRACDWFVCGDAVFDARDVPALADRSLVPGLADGEVRTTTLERWSLPTKFNRVYGDALREAPLVRVVTGLTCTEVVCTDDGSQVDYLVARTLDGRRVTIAARRHVLACGGLETTRLLLASRRHHPDGIGNHSGHLGRWYMAHVESRIARARFSGPPEATIYGHERDGDGVYVRRRVSFAPELLAAHGLPNAVLWLANPEIGDASHRSGILSFVYLMLISPLGRFFVAEGIRAAHIETTRRTGVRSHLRNVLGDLGPAAAFAVRFGFQRFVRRGRKVPGFFVRSASNTYPLVFHGEHRPHRESVVHLTDETDALGMPRLRTHLHFADEEVADVLRLHERLDAYLREHGCGELEYLDDDLEASVRRQLFGGYHQSGTTRMSADAADGVVDGDLAVHGFADLYVASSSTFVTSSQANSTFMVVVFALRLAERLSGDLREPGEPRA